MCMPANCRPRDGCYQQGDSSCSQRELELAQPLRAIKTITADRKLDAWLLFLAAQAKVAQPLAASFIRGGRANHGEQPGLERRAPMVASPALQNFQIRCLQGVLCQ